MSDATPWVGIGISAGSLIMSTIAVWISSRAQSKAVAAQKRIVEIEEQREKEKFFEAKQASLRPELRKTQRGSYRLYLVNHGKAEARNIRIKLDGTRLAEHCAGEWNDPVPGFLGPGAECSVLLSIGFDCVPPFEFEIVWDDDYGVHRTYRTMLTL